MKPLEYIQRSINDYVLLCASSIGCVGADSNTKQLQLERAARGEGDNTELMHACACILRAKALTATLHRKDRPRLPTVPRCLELLSHGFSHSNNRN
jgi:hypothetical protein